MSARKCSARDARSDNGLEMTEETDRISGIEEMGFVEIAQKRESRVKAGLR